MVQVYLPPRVAAIAAVIFLTGFAGPAAAAVRASIDLSAQAMTVEILRQFGALVREEFGHRGELGMQI